MSIQAARRPALVERGSEEAKDAGSWKYTDRTAELEKTAPAAILFAHEPVRAMLEPTMSVTYSRSGWFKLQSGTRTCRAVSPAECLLRPSAARIAKLRKTNLEGAADPPCAGRFGGDLSYNQWARG
jgi:hypothetical protein